MPTPPTSAAASPSSRATGAPRSTAYRAAVDADPARPLLARGARRGPGPDRGPRRRRGRGPQGDRARPRRARRRRGLAHPGQDRHHRPAAGRRRARAALRRRGPVGARRPASRPARRPSTPIPGGCSPRLRLDAGRRSRGRGRPRGPGPAPPRRRGPRRCATWVGSSPTRRTSTAPRRSTAGRWPLERRDAEAWRRLAELEESRRRFDEARKAWEGLVRQDPDDPDGLVALGRLSLRSGNADAARAFFEQAIHVSADEVEVRTRVAFAWLDARRPAEAHRRGGRGAQDLGATAGCSTSGGSRCGRSGAGPRPLPPSAPWPSGDPDLDVAAIAARASVLAQAGKAAAGLSLLDAALVGAPGRRPARHGPRLRPREGRAGRRGGELPPGAAPRAAAGRAAALRAGGGAGAGRRPRRRHRHHAQAHRRGARTTPRP